MLLRGEAEDREGFSKKEHPHRDLSTALPRISCETRGFDDLHAALFTESRTRGRRKQREVGNPGSLRSR